MAVVSRIAAINFDNFLGSTKTWTATAATQDTAAGSSVVVTINRVNVGSIPPADPDTLTLAYHDDAGTLIKSVALNTTTFPQTDTFFFTSTGLTGGAARAGTVEIKLRATKTTGGPTATYDVETDGSPNTPPSTFTIQQLDRGWIRGTTTATTAISNVAAGGAKTAPAQYDEGLHTRTTLGATLYVARTLTIDLQVAGVTPTGLSGATNSASSGNFDRSFAAVVDSRFVVGVSTVTTLLTIPNATLTSLPFTVLTTNTTDTITVDPRLTVAHLMQTDDNSYGTPPLSKNSLSGQRLTTQIAYLSANLRSARGTRVGNVITGGTNGVAYRATLQDSAAATAAITRDVTTTTTGGEAGWGGPDFMQWTSALPGGSWTKTVTLQASVTDLTNAYLIGNTVTYTLLAIDPNLALRGYLNKAPGGSGIRHHFVAGVDGVYLTLLIVDQVTGIRVNPSRITDVMCSMSRVATSAEQSEYLNADETTWAVWTPTAAQPTFAMTVSPADARMYVKSFPAANTATWTRDMRCGFSAKIDGTPYYSFAFREEAGGSNTHEGFVLDAVGLALTGGLTFK